MSNETKKTALPKLRFPEFQEAGEWEEKKLGELFLERQENNFLELPLLSLTNKEGMIPQEESNRKNTSNSDKKKYLRVCPGDIAYNTMRMWEGRSAFVTTEGIISPAYTVCNPKDNIDGLFFSYYFKTQQLVQQFHKYSQGLVKDTLNLKFQAFSRISALTPVKLKEQRKIAAALSSIDDLLTVQSDKLVALETHRQGLMNGLFPDEGETVPKLRFPEFQDAEEWIQQELGEISTITSGATPNRSKPEYWNGNIPWVTTSLVDFNIINFANQYITEAGLQNSSAKLFPKGTILMAMYGQGKTRGQVAILGIDAATNQACAAILLKKEFDTNFVYQNLAARYQEIRELSNQGGQENLSGALIKSIPFAYPGIEEQQKIADCLTSLNNRISAQSQKIEALKLHKKGLMQNLFPAAAEPTI